MMCWSLSNIDSKECLSFMSGQFPCCNMLIRINGRSILSHLVIYHVITIAIVIAAARSCIVVIINQIVLFTMLL